ncbi:hypothetical protein [Nocardia tengchongensis]|uniref:hypothetical protein n=1 Tax=Nocardia tengchongensis TaxID=2055889 RepID=UPI0036C6AEBB
MSAWASVINVAVGVVTGGVGTQVIAAIRHRRLDDAQVDVQRVTGAQILSNMQHGLAEDLQEDNRVLRGELRQVKAQLTGVERKLDALIGVCGDTLRHLDALGEDTETYRAALRNSM